MTKLERLLRGDKATFVGHPIIHVKDYSDFDGVNDSHPVMFAYVSGGRVFSEFFNKGLEGKIDFYRPEKSIAIKAGDVLEKEGHGDLEVQGVIGNVLVFICSSSEFPGMILLEKALRDGYKLKTQ